MGKSTPSGNVTQTTTNQPWSVQAPFLSTEFNQASDLLKNNPLTFYPGQTVAPVGPQTYQALNLQQNRALSGSPVTNAADSYATNLENGNFLSAGNPYFQNMTNSIAQAIKPQIDSQFNADGRSGSGANDQAFASALTNAVAPMAFQNYNNTLGLMNSQAFNAPNLANQDYTDISQLGNVGQATQALQQPYINEDMARFAQNQMQPFQNLQLFGTAIGNPFAGGGSTTSPYFNNSAAGLLGAGLGGLSLFNGVNQVSNGGLSSAIGGLLGKGSASGLGSGGASLLSSAIPGAAGSGIGLIGDGLMAAF